MLGFTTLPFTTSLGSFKVGPYWPLNTLLIGHLLAIFSQFRNK
jgi:hypothetical protein